MCQALCQRLHCVFREHKFAANHLPENYLLPWLHNPHKGNKNINYHTIIVHYWQTFAHTFSFNSHNKLS